MGLKIFPIGVQDFAKLRNDGKYYVDKTDLIYKLTHTSDYYFMSRPRRFGKSLLISTLECYFQGRKELFAGLAIEDLETKWESFPVIRLDLSQLKGPNFAVNMDTILGEYEEIYKITNIKDETAWGARLANIITQAHKQTGKGVVVLIDEYDTLMLEALDDPEKLQEMRGRSRDLYSPIKTLGGILRFVFITGISKFSQLSIFSELNNLKVITMTEEYAGLCGITREELLEQMQPEIQALADKNGLSYEDACEKLKEQYNGYHFAENLLDVYNPFSLINALDDKTLKNYWFSTGTPTMLVKAIKKYRMDPEIFDKGFPATPKMFDTPLETATDPIPVLYQSGYLTIKHYEDGVYTLAYPNHEVRSGFLEELLPNYVQASGCERGTLSLTLRQAFLTGTVETGLEALRAFLSSIPYDTEKQDENHYKTVLYIVFRVLTEYSIGVEVRSAAGRADIVVETKDSVYVFEFKLDGNATVEDALRQIDDKGYLVPYTATLTAAGTPKALYKIGVSFDPAHRTIGEWKIVKA